MSATPRPAAAPPRARRAPLGDLLKVTLDHRASTPFDELYRASSDTTLGRVYEVRHHLEDDAWACQCVGAAYGHECRHIRRAKRLRAVQWWSARLAELTRDEQHAERERRLARVAAGLADDDDLACIDTIDLLLTEARAA